MVWLQLDSAAARTIPILFAAVVGVLTIPAFITWRLARRGEGGWAELTWYGSWVVWIALERYLDLSGSLGEVFPGLSRFAAPTLSFLLPGVISMVTCWSIWHWPPRRPVSFAHCLRREAEDSAKFLYLALCLSIIGYPWSPGHEIPYMAMILSAAAVAVIFELLSRARNIGENLPAEAPLHQRATALAERAGVRLDGVRTLPDDPFGGSTAGAQNRKIVISAAFERTLPAAQVDFLLAHEIAHVKHRDSLRSLLFVVAYLATVDLALRQVLALVLHPAWHILPQVAAAMLSVRLVCHRSEYQADALAAELTSPETAVRCLLTLGRLNRCPLTSPPLLEAFASHPSLIHRLQAIARKCGQSSEWLRTLILEENPNTDLKALATLHESETRPVPLVS